VTDLSALTVRTAGDLLDARSLSSQELVEATLARIEETEPLLHAYVRVMADSARAAARRADEERANGVRRSPLHGIPVAVKDVLWTHDAPTEAGSRVLAGFLAPEDATAVRRLREAGAVLVGKHVTHEFACGQDVPATRSAWNSEHYPGGSSAGAGVSVAVGSSLAAIGTDAGGSVRKPASINGVAGLKATYGRISRHGVIPPTGTLDHVAIVARTVEDCALLLHELAGPDPADPTALDEPVPDYVAALEGDLAGTRVGVPGYFFGGELEAEVRTVVESALGELEQLGAELVQLELPSFELTLPVGFTILLAEGGASHLGWLREQPQDYGPDTRRLLELGALLPAGLVEAARRARSLMRSEVREAFRSAGLDALATPTLPRLSIPIDEMVIPVDLPRYIAYTMPFNLTGLPAITVPCGVSSAGLPVGLQLAGAPLAEATVLRIAHAYEQATSWHLRRPTVAGAA